jgi:hypothetical protein
LAIQRAIDAGMSSATAAWLSQFYPLDLNCRIDRDKMPRFASGDLRP